MNPDNQSGLIGRNNASIQFLPLPHPCSSSHGLCPASRNNHRIWFHFRASAACIIAMIGNRQHKKADDQNYDFSSFIGSAFEKPFCLRRASRRFPGAALSAQRQNDSLPGIDGLRRKAVLYQNRIRIFRKVDILTLIRSRSGYRYPGG